MNRIHILLVEDNEGDIILTKEAFEESEINNSLSVVKNGIDALDYVFKRGKFMESESPELILLDLNLPKKNGFEVLEILKSSDKTRHIPIIILSTTSSQRDVNLAYHYQANCFLSKPLEIDDFMEMIHAIEYFWMSLVKFPNKNILAQ
ncbi:MAG: response regulator [Chitinophagaceae bacterium]|nr:MAG: response regulator [Chitinophagaceae bacterium]